MDSELCLAYPNIQGVGSAPGGRRWRGSFTRRICRSRGDYDYHVMQKFAYQNCVSNIELKWMCWSFERRIETILLMEEILHQLRLIVYPTIYRVLNISGGCLGFLPSTVWNNWNCSGWRHDQEDGKGPPQEDTVWDNRWPLPQWHPSMF